MVWPCGPVGVADLRCVCAVKGVSGDDTAGASVMRPWATCTIQTPSSQDSIAEYRGRHGAANTPALTHSQVRAYHNDTFRLPWGRMGCGGDGCRLRFFGLTDLICVWGTAMVRTALVTGTSGGIGLELAKLLARDRYDLVLVARSEDKLVELGERLKSQFGVGTQVIVKDLSVRGSADEVFDELASRGTQIDVLVNNAGFGLFGEFTEIDWDSQERMIELNVMTLTRLTRLFVPGMVERGGGKILNLASTAAFQPGPLMAAYYATKAYVLHFSEAIANELAGTGVTVTALCPGPTATGFQAVASAEESRMVKGKRLPTAEQVARYGYKALMKGRRVAIHGFGNWALAQSVRFAPRGAVVAIVRWMSEKI